MSENIVEYFKLKEQVEALGYQLIKKRESVRISPCLCGAKRGIHAWYTTGELDGRFMRCEKCDLQGPIAKTETKAKMEWNKMIEFMKSKKEG